MATHAHLDRLASPSEGQGVGKTPGEGVLNERQWNGCSSSFLALLGMPTAQQGAEQAVTPAKSKRGKDFKICIKRQNNADGNQPPRGHSFQMIFIKGSKRKCR